MTGRTGGVGAARLRYHRGENVLLSGLAALVVLAGVIGPLYARAVEQATARSTLVDADRVSRGLVLRPDDQTSTATSVPPALTGRLWGTGVGSVDVPTSFRHGDFLALATTYSYRDDECTHLTFTQGRCPTGDDEVAVSASTARAVGLAVGDTVTGSVRVVGLYRPFDPDDDYWFGHEYSSAAGIRQNRDEGVVVDAMFATAGFTADQAQQLLLATDETSPRREVDVPLHADRVRLSDLPTLRQTLATVRRDGTTVSTALDSFLDGIDRSRHDARVVVLAVGAQLVLLTLVTFGVVVAAAADRRRTELALVRLRGRGAGAAAGQFAREVGGVAAVGVLPGLALGWLAVRLAGLGLGGGAGPELRWPVVVAAVATCAAAAGVVAVVGGRTGRVPIPDLLRRIPLRARRGGTVIEAAVGALAVVGVVLSLSSRGGGALTTVTPTSIAVLVGLVAARLLVVVGAPRLGRRALRRRDVVTSFAAFGLARRPGARLTVTVLCVATAAVVVGAQQWAAAAAARQQRAAAETGAAVVLTLDAPSTGSVRQAVRTADPSGTWATPVVVVNPPGAGAEPVVAVDPTGFAAVATWGRADLRPSSSELAALTPRGLAPSIPVRGTSAGLQLSRVAWAAIAPPEPGLGIPPPPGVGVDLDLVHDDGRTTSASLGPLPSASTGPLALSSPVSCSDGCRVTGLTIVRPTLDTTPVEVSFDVTAVTSSGATTPVGQPAVWTSVTERHDVPGSTRTTAMTVAGGSGGVRFTAVDDGRGAAVQYLDRPVAAPALVAGTEPTDRDALGYLEVADPYGGTRRVRSAGSVSFVPGIGSPAVLVDVDQVAFDPHRLDATAHVEVWTRTDDPRRLATLTADLTRAGVAVDARQTSAAVVAADARTGPAWSADLALAAAVFAELVAVLLLALVVATSRPSRRQDLDALRLVGVGRRRLRRATSLELVVVAVVGTVLGTAAGVVGARWVLPHVPVASTAPSVPITPSFALQWTWLVAAVVLGVVLLVPTALGLAAWVAGRAPRRAARSPVGRHRSATLQR